MEGGRLLGALSAVATTSLCPAATAAADDRVYWANYTGNKISFANADGSGGAGDLSTGAATVSNPFGIAVDPAAGRVYWANYAGNKISFANLDGSGGADLTITGATVSGPEGLAIDPAAGRSIWVNNNSPPGPFMANLDAGGGAPVNTAPATVPAHRGRDRSRGWATLVVQQQPREQDLLRQPGRQRGRRPHRLGRHGEPPRGACDRPDRRPDRWANFGASTIASANLDGSGGAALDTTGASPPSDPAGVAVDQGLAAGASGGRAS